MRFPVHHPEGAAVRILRVCDTQRLDQRTEERCAGGGVNIQLEHVTRVQRGKVALIVAPPGGLCRRGKPSDKTNRHFHAGSVYDRLVERTRVCFAHRIENAGQQLKIGIGSKHGVGDCHVSGQHIAVHFQLREIKDDFIDVGNSFRPHGVRCRADDVLAGLAAQGFAVDVLPQFGVLVHQIAQDLHKLSRNTQLSAGRAVLLSAELTEPLKELLRAVTRQQLIALLISQAEPAAFGIAHVYIAPFVVGVAGVRIGHRIVGRRRRLRGLQTADLLLALLDLALNPGEFRRVRVAFLFKRIDRRRYYAALIVGHCLRDCLTELFLAGGEAVAHLLQRRELRAKRLDLTVEHQNSKY